MEEAMQLYQLAQPEISTLKLNLLVPFLGVLD